MMGKEKNDGKRRTNSCIASLGFIVVISWVMLWFDKHIVHNNKHDRVPDCTLGFGMVNEDMLRNPVFTGYSAWQDRSDAVLILGGNRNRDSLVHDYMHSTSLMSFLLV
jgi:hypothetical protein